MTSRNISTGIWLILAGSAARSIRAWADRRKPQPLHTCLPTAMAPSTKPNALSSDPRGREPDWHGQWRVLKYL
jgi:hypothetical protein